MFVQIINALSKIIGLISNSGVLFDRSKRRKIGSKLVELHQTISRIQENSQNIEKMLIEISKAESDKYELCNYYLFGLDNLFEIQLKELRRLKEILQDDATATLVDIYDNNSTSTEQQTFYAILSLVGCKISIIDVIHILFNSQDKEYLILPKSIDLIDMPILNKIVKEQGISSSPSKYFNELLSYGEFQDIACYDLQKDFVIKIPKYGAFESHEHDVIKKKKTMELIINSSIPLIKQIIDLHSSTKLLEIKKMLGNIIKENFKIDEII